MDFNAMLNRVIRAARLDVAFYNEAEADASLNREALTVVIIVALLTGIGGFVGAIFAGVPLVAMILTLVWGIVWSIIGYYIWAYLTWFIGTRVFEGTATPDELLRTLGYAYGPQALGIFNAIPCFGGFIALIGSLWSLVAGVIAVREALDFTTGKAIITVVIGWLVIFVVGALIAGILGLGAFGLSALTGSFQ